MSEPTTTAEALADLADWLDAADPIIDAAFRQEGKVRPDEGSREFQRVLRAWASYLEAHPSADADLWAVVPVGPE